MRVGTPFEFGRVGFLVRLRRAGFCSALLSYVFASAVVAQEATFEPLVEARLRNEHVDQEAIAKPADAVTLRVRAGVEANLERWSALVEGQGTVALLDHYYDGLNGAENRPLVADPPDAALYRAQIGYKDADLAVTVGRQEIVLDEQRFVTSAPFRQNGETFDAARLSWIGAQKLSMDITYAWNEQTIWGVRGTGTRPPNIPGPKVFTEFGYTAPIGTLTAFSYLVGQDEAAIDYRMSSRTAGARLVGERIANSDLKFNYELSYASQAGWRSNPNRYTARFYLLDVSAQLSRVAVGAGYEVAGASGGAPLTSFQFPVGSGFRYRGWDSKFFPTPPDGVRDLYGSLAYTIPQSELPFKIEFQSIYHYFESDRLVRHYGSELDLLARAQWGRYTASVRFAGYHASLFATDTRKLWLQLDWVYGAQGARLENVFEPQAHVKSPAGPLGDAATR